MLRYVIVGLCVAASCLPSRGDEIVARSARTRRYVKDQVKPAISKQLVSFETMADSGTATRLQTKQLPTNLSTVTVRDSVAGSFMASVGNGYLGTVVYGDAIHVSGVFNGKSYPKKRPVYPVYYGQHAHRARIPSTAAIEFKVRGVSGNESFALDVYDGVFYKWFASKQSTVEQRVYGHRERRNLLVVEITAKNDGPEEMIVDLTEKRGNKSLDVDFKDVPLASDIGALAMLGQVNETEEPEATRARLAVVYSPVPKNLTVGPASSVTWYFITAIATSLDTKFAPLSEATRHFIEAKRDKTKLLSEHKAAWRAIWNQGGKIDIEGNLELAKSVYASLYYVLSSTRADWPYGLSPGGIPGGEEYMGHTFWDQDIWMYPTLVLLYPDLARAALRYRFDRLPAARRIARHYGYKGAMFPWESAFTGLETSPGERYGKYQNHITGDVAFAAKQYWMVTKDFQWLRQIGYALVSQTAEFWASRVEYSEAKRKYVINHVMPPDEYHFPVNNSVYTNVVAKLNLEFAVEVARLLGKSVPREWGEIAENMYIPFDEAKNYHPEFEGYDLSKQAKQADTILIGYPLMFDMEPKVRENDLRFYEKSTDPDGPAMTHAMFAIGWLELREMEKARTSFYRNYANIQGPFKVWSEHRYGHGAANFITGAGGFLQAVVYGYGGFRLGANELKFNPVLPPSSTKLVLDGVNYLGSSLRFEVQEDSVEITLVSSAPIAPELEAVVQGISTELDVGRAVSMARARGVIRMRSTALKPTVHSAGSASRDVTYLGLLLSVFVLLCSYVVMA